MTLRRISGQTFEVVSVGTMARWAKSNGIKKRGAGWVQAINDARRALDLHPFKVDPRMRDTPDGDMARPRPPEIVSVMIDARDKAVLANAIMDAAKEAQDEARRLDTEGEKIVLRQQSIRLRALIGQLVPA
jgi:hypothetical protein